MLRANIIQFIHNTYNNLWDNTNRTQYELFYIIHAAAIHVSNKLSALSLECDLTFVISQ